MPSVTEGPAEIVRLGTSSSVRLSAADVTATPSELPDTVTVSGFSSSLSSTGVSVNVAVPLACPAAIEMWKPPTGKKSTAESAPLPDTLALTFRAAA